LIRLSQSIGLYATGRPAGRLPNLASDEPAAAAVKDAPKAHSVAAGKSMERGSAGVHGATMYFTLAAMR